MHLMSTVKFIVLTVAFATQCVYAKSRNGYGYFDEKFCVLEWIIYLKRLSLIALMLCGIVLYYVPKSRSYVRRACCILIDIVANGLKFALNTNEIEHEKIKAGDKNNESKELKIQELYRKVYEEDATDHEQKYINKTDFGNSNHKSIRKYKKKKSCTKHNVNGKRERHRHNRDHRNATNDIMPESDAMIINSPQQIIERCEKTNMAVLQNAAPKTRIIMCTLSVDKLKNNIDLRQENSLNKKTNSSMASEIIDKNDIKSKLMCENNDYQEYINNNLPMTEVSDNLREINYVQSSNKKFKTITFQKQENVSDINTDKKFQDKQNFDYMKIEKVAIPSQHQSSKDCATRMNKQMDPCYEKLFTKRERDELRKENCRFLPDMKSFTHDCYENSPITKNRVKPVLLRVVNWFFGGCPEASRRHREQVDQVGKEEIFEYTNTWLL